MARPVTPEKPAFYQGYIDLVPENDIFLALENNMLEIKELIPNIHASKASFAYAPGKWTVAQSLQHVMDAERIFAYRALRIARGDKTPLPGWEENAYAANAMASQRTIADLAEELYAVRRATTLLFCSFTDDCWERTGNANGRDIDVLTIAYLVVGHMRHHINIFRQRYEIQP
ncbi:MAG TPA: DinB family protein [Dinghuibacter sp.]|nr:DinB family protein [Dinghuibacter sp.]HTJ11810.1 DinB family protein [Dinghuibacter sp.]